MDPAQGGQQREEYSRRLAGALGVPDFVYEPAVEAKGRGQREISDGLLVCGGEGVILQVKSRRPDSAATDTDAKAESWIRKGAEDALRQVLGTRRRLDGSKSVRVRSLRGFTREIFDAGGWPGVVVLDHPRIPDGIVLEQFDDIYWTTLDDWFELHDWLRSTAAVIGYVQRALRCGLHPPLGYESLRYFRLADADDRAHGGPTSRPLLPPRPIEGRDRLFASIIDDWIEHVWPQDGPYTWRDPDEYRRIVELLDRIPPAFRVELGRKAFHTLRAMDERRRRRSFFFRVTSLNARFLFVADAAERYEDPETQFMAEVGCLGLVRHAQAVEAGEPSAPTLAVARLEDRGRGCLYNFVYIEGPPSDVDQEVRWAISSTYGIYNGTGITAVEDVGRNSRCPCGSERKFKHCHLSEVPRRQHDV
jgi:SEC-C motif